MTSAADTPVCFNPKQPGRVQRQMEGSLISLQTKIGAAGNKIFKTAFERSRRDTSNAIKRVKK